MVCKTETIDALREIITKAGFEPISDGETDIHFSVHFFSDESVGLKATITGMDIEDYLDTRNIDHSMRVEAKSHYVIRRWTLEG